MSDQAVTILGIIFGLPLTALASILVARIGRSSSADTFTINLMTRLEKVEGRCEKLEAEVHSMARREDAFYDYVHRLRQHIDSEVGPPAPDWPDILTPEGT